jgi:hypothetical protein
MVAGFSEKGELPCRKSGIGSPGREVLMNSISGATFSTIVRAGRTTYFVDVREARNCKKFLSISESRIDADEKRQRSTLRVFSETVEQFRQAIDEAAAVVAE